MNAEQSPTVYPILPPSCSRIFFPKCRLFFWTLLYIFLVTLHPQTAFAEQHLITHEAKVERAVNVASVVLDIKPADIDSVRNLLKDGAQIELAVELTLKRERSWWKDASEIRKVYFLKLRHDPLTREFVLSFPGNADQQAEIREKSLYKLFNTQWNHLTFPLLTKAELETLAPDYTYFVEVLLAFYHVEVPPWLEKSTLFWSSEVAPPVILELPFPNAETGN